MPADPPPTLRRPRALVTAPLRGAGLDRLLALCDVVHEPWIDQRPLRIYDAAGLADRLAHEGATVAVIESDSVGGPVWDLPLLAVAATRGDPTNVDLAGATAAGVPVLHTPARNADAVAELTVGLLLAVARAIVAADGDVRAGEVWRGGTIPYQRFRGWELRGRTVGLVGYGAVGRAVAWRLEALGMRVVAHDPYRPDAAATLAELLASSDVVSVHAAVTAETVGLIGAAQLAAMRPGSVLINTARAALVDTGALVGALSSGHIAGAAIDHFDGETLPAGHALLTMPNVVLTPHIGGATFETEARAADMVASDLERLLAGSRPLHLANPEVLGSDQVTAAVGGGTAP